MVALKTFNNLKPERRQEIIDTCLEEFSVHDYESASLSDIIKKLALAKGSFYRYFESKQALYLYLLNFCLEKRLEHDKAVVNNTQDDFFNLYTAHFEARIQFEKKHPFPSAFLHNLLRQKTVPELGDIQLLAKKRIVELMKPRILEDIKKGRIREDLDPDLLAFIMAQTQMLITDYISYKYGLDYCKHLLNKKSTVLQDKDIVQNGKKIIEILKTGFQSKK